MEHKNKIIISTLVVIGLILNVVFKSNEPTDDYENAITADQQFIETPEVDAYTPVVSPQKVKTQAAQRKQNVKSQIARFRKKIQTNNPTIIPTRAHQFHNPEGSTLSGKRKTVIAKKKKNKAPLTEEEIAKAQKQAKEQAKIQEFMKRECGTIKDNTEKAECHQAVANHFAEEKKKAAEKKAKEEQKAAKKQNGSKDTANNNNNSNESDEDTDEQNEDDTTDDEIAPTISGIAPTTAPNTNTSGDDDRARRTLAEWKTYIESETNGKTMQKKALEIHAATSKTGSDGISEADFLVLIREYYLDSEDAALEKAGMQALDKTASQGRFSHSVYFLSKQQIGSSSEELAELKNNFRYFYLQDDRTTALNIYLNSLPLPVATEDAESGEVTETSWSSKDPLYVTIDLIREYASARLNEVNNIDPADTDNINKARTLESTIASLNNDLKSMSEDESIQADIRSSMNQALNNVSQLLEKVQSLSPTTNNESTTTPNTNGFNFNRK